MVSPSIAQGDDDGRVIESTFVAAGISEGAGVIEYDGENDQKQKRESTVTDSFPSAQPTRDRMF